MRDISKLKFDIHSTFFPGQHIIDPAWFAGRKFDIEKALKALCRPGASIIIFGERGVGKSSFAEMIKQIATGNSHLIYRHQFHKIYPPEKFKYKVISIECDAETNNVPKVLQRLITSPNGIKKIISGKLEKVEESFKDKLTFDIFKIFSFGAEDEKKSTYTEFKEETTIELFTNLIQTISQEFLNRGEGLLICIDEFDLVYDNSKMASVIKTLSKNNVKFMLTGISDSYENLLIGHQSVIRQFFEGRILIDPMKKEELQDIYNLVTLNSQNTLHFSDNFIERAIEKSNGYPYYAQLFGQLALDNLIKTEQKEGPLLINSQHLNQGLKLLIDYEPILDKEYLDIIGENKEKEFLLRALARQTPKNISDMNVSNYCSKRGMKNPKNILSSLLGHRNPHFLIRVKDTEFITFMNPLFKTFVNSRDTEYINITEDGELQLS